MTFGQRLMALGTALMGLEAPQLGDWQDDR